MNAPPQPPWPPAYAGRAWGERRRGGWRQVAAAILVVLGCVLAPLAVAGVWVHSSLMSTEGYVEAITPVADVPAVRDAIVEALSGQVFGALDIEGTLEGALPAGLSTISGVLSGQLENLTKELTRQVAGTSAFREAWAAANKASHPILINVIEGRGPQELTLGGLVTLDLSEVAQNVTELLRDAGLAVPESSGLAEGDISLLDWGPISRARVAISVLDRFYLLLAAAAALCLLAAPLLAVRRLRILLLLGIGLVVAMLFFQIGQSLLRTCYAGVAGDAGIAHAVSAGVWDVVTRELWSAGWIGFGMGALLALIAAIGLLVRRRSRMSRRPPVAAIRRAEPLGRGQSSGRRSGENVNQATTPEARITHPATIREKLTPLRTASYAAPMTLATIGPYCCSAAAAPAAPLGT